MKKKTPYKVLIYSCIDYQTKNLSYSGSGTRCVNTICWNVVSAKRYKIREKISMLYLHGWIMNTYFQKTVSKQAKWRNWMLQKKCNVLLGSNVSDCPHFSLAETACCNFKPFLLRLEALQRKESGAGAGGAHLNPCWAAGFQRADCWSSASHHDYHSITTLI